MIEIILGRAKHASRLIPRRRRDAKDTSGEEELQAGARLKLGLQCSTTNLSLSGWTCVGNAGEDSRRMAVFNSNPSNLMGS
jgi:hypothetical protein